jgi:hypothetical protein
MFTIPNQLKPGKIYLTMKDRLTGNSVQSEGLEWGDHFSSSEWILEQGAMNPPLKNLKRKFCIKSIWS